jgi:glycosyltransferase involved in cell wall biosynthesis
VPRLRVAHVVVTRQFAGVERYLGYVAPALAELDIDVAVIGGHPESMRHALEGSKVTHIDARGMVGAARAASRLRADIVHAHMTKAELAAAAATVFTPARVVATRHFAARRGSSLGARLLAPLLASRICRQVAISEFVANAVEGPVQVIANGVPCSDAGGHADAVVIVAQRLEEEKETDVAVRAWAKAKARLNGWRLVIAGRGACEASLRSLVAELGVSDSVDFVGFVRDPGARIGRAAVLLATAPKEPFGLTVAEAMASATPIVAAGGGAHLETIGAVSSDWLFPPGDVEACADALDRIALATPEDRAEYGERLRSHQRQRFSIEVHVEALARLYGGVAKP